VGVERKVKKMPFKKGDKKIPGSGRKKGQAATSTTSIKTFTMELLDREDYRESLQKRILEGLLPQVELFLLTKTLGKPTEHLEISAPVPLFNITGRTVDEGELLAEVVVRKQLLSGEEDGSA